MAIDRRKHKRVKKAVYFKITGNIHEEETLDISLGGLLMQANRFYQIGQRLSLQIIIPNEKSIYCASRVVWIYPRLKDSPSFKVGLQFLNMSIEDNERLKQYLQL